MNIIKIFEIDQFQSIINDLLCLSGVQSEEIYHNMWCIALGDDLIKNIKVEQLKYFVDRLIENREQQLKHINFHKNVVFYMWFDQQVLQLRFNVITGNVESLPFGCKLRLVNTVEPILSDFINTLKDIIRYGDMVQFFDKNQVDDFDDDENEEEYILDIFVRQLIK